jgi:rod shape-determining protein MreD
MRRLLISIAVVAVALLAQLTFVSRLALPGAAGPDLVLLAVVALALTGGPLAGLLTGFLAGLALDVAPPASHTIGQYALVFCVVGYACGRLAGLGDASPALYVAISAAAAAVGAALHAALGVMLSDPEVTWAAVRHVLPPSLIYDVILSPFVLYAVVRLNGWAARGAGESAAVAPASVGWAGNAGLAGLTTGSVRQVSASGTPKLNLGDRRGGGTWIAAAGAASAARSAVVWRPGAQRDPKLHFSGARGAGGGSAATGRLGGGAGLAGLAGRKSPKVRFRAGRGNSLAGRGNSLAGRGSGLAGRGNSLPGRPVTPRFHRRRVTGTIGTGGALSRATPRRGTFAGHRSLGRRPSLGGGSPGTGISARRGPFGRGVSGRGVSGRGMSGRGVSGRGLFRRRSLGRGSFGSMSSGRGLRGGPGSGRGSLSRGSAPRLRMRRGSLRARWLRFLNRGRGGYR